MGLVDTGELLLVSAVGVTPFKGLSGKTTAACGGARLAAAVAADSLASAARVSSEAAAPLTPLPNSINNQSFFVVVVQ